MYFTRARFYKLPNNEFTVILFASKAHYGNKLGVLKGVSMDETSRSFITLAKWVLAHHTRVKSKRRKWNKSL